MKSFFLASFGLLLGAANAQAAVLNFVITDPLVDWENAVSLVETTTSTTLLDQAAGTLDPGTAVFAFNDLGAGSYEFTVSDIGDGMIEYYALTLNGDVLDDCFDCTITSRTTSFTIGEVPLPASAFLLFAGFAGLGVLRRRG